MIPRNEIARIKITQKDAGLDDKTYRDILASSAGVRSCTALESYQVPDVIKAIKATSEQRKGWKGRQLSKFRQYAKFAKMNPKEYRIFLMETIHIPHEESPLLKQDHFDIVMAELEAELEVRITLGDVANPAKININYWRDRKPKTGQSNTRETHKIWEAWNNLTSYLRPEKRNLNYLFGIAQKCCHRHISDIAHISAQEAFFVIEALKAKRSQLKQKLDKEVPF